VRSEIPQSTDVSAKVKPIVNAMSFDVEDYFQVQALADVFDRSNWDACELRVERNTDLILADLADARATATFFVLGWVAERCPNLIRRIVAGGHELASHGYAHFRVDGQSAEEFRSDIRRTKRCLEDVSGTRVEGYRAATFSIGPKESWAFPILEEEGYRYSSSIYPFNSDLHAYADAPRFAFRPKGTRSFTEYPISTVRVGGRNFPSGGGGYFRFLPYALSRAAIARVNEQDRQPAIFYLHPWEFDPEQPRPSGVSLKSRFRHYLNLDLTRARLRRLLSDFRWASMSSIWPADDDRRAA
jgi:polysaccharide deacetylase family protein (PEP-CTERM system associated)